MLQLFRDNPLLLLFVVAALGSLVGQLKLFGFGLGVAAVLFVGLGAGALDPDLKLPEVVSSFGLVLFVYTVGLSSGPGFFASFRRRGLRDNALSVGVLTAIAALSALFARLLGFDAGQAAGIFAGALTNAPGLAGVLETMKARTPAAPEALLAEPVVAFSLTYPMGVVGVLLGIYLYRRLARVDYDKEPLSSLYARAVARSLANQTVRITRARTREEAMAALREARSHVLFGRMKRGDAVSIVADDASFEAGDLVTIIGAAGDVRAAIEVLGEASDERLDLDRKVLDFRRMFVSRSAVTEKPLKALGLPQRFGALVTRIRRGDVELLPEAETELELGDRVRVVAPRERMEEIAKLFGDSYKSLSEIDVLTFGVGIALGLVAGSVPIPLPGGATFKLGFAGGPLLVGLLLGRLGRTGKLVWTMPYSANLTLRQLGLVLFLAAVGTRSGWVFAKTLQTGGTIILVGAGLTLISTFAVLLLGHRVLGIPLALLNGIVSGTQTQPAALAFAGEQTKNDLPNVGYATVFPLATIAKIVLAQLVYVWVR